MRPGRIASGAGLERSLRGVQRIEGIEGRPDLASLEHLVGWHDVGVQPLRHRPELADPGLQIVV